MTRAALQPMMAREKIPDASGNLANDAASGLF
jgi:hypothetical protein